MEKRRHERIESSKILADISDGLGFYTGIVKDFSRSGLLLEDVPKRLDDTSAQVSVIIASGTANFKLKAKKRWTKPQAFSKMIGFELTDAPLGWAEFVMKNESLLHKSPGEITI